MKEIVIQGRHIRRELLVWVGCVVALTAWNAYAIATHHTQWSELYALWYVILPLSVVLYMVLIPFRLVSCRLGRFMCRNRKKTTVNP